ncbi:MAG: hypothetical protein A2750_03910 [Candidatus Yanofskybacteria bacterium RIFCSPHIGHO2_01_FULL_45_42]|uniref:HTH arsR-type domain-containing protein n=2 Tax=Candidatus Yanofskyibacteriota TaxID=1752733 RepID=A0A1F8EZS3_9BACT|nr:MAG: hypothetical protein A2750_03910 [Candidatus Yanofskybacteria bacterium RIFCSPHIGHO2_01_FULL_45_42]OGN26153.1 MAG: hypothetical protein A3B17_02235 [Candidatus Yanofskybacteria bacterium RIFCSPLOWO2_01_FULL_45_72]OGN32124.1 MAG: hypothetical protein A3J01_00820 [Candidatus Yanofskybacteria bacterium RIFCSPLOWO2_02_FULL_45_18]
MSKHILDNLFNSHARVKILKFLFRNYPNEFNVGELARRIQETYRVTKKEIGNLEELGLVYKSRKTA